MEIKKILRQYLFTLIIIVCIYTMAAGIFTVKEKTQYNIDMTSYSKVQLEKTEKIELCAQDFEQASAEKSFKSMMQKKKTAARLGFYE